MMKRSRPCKFAIDGDELVYRVGFASQSVRYQVGLKTFETADDIKEYMALYEIDEDIQKYTDLVHIDIAYSNLELTLNSILEKVQDKDDFTVFFSGERNFRNEIATILPYKGNRSKASRPEYYQLFKDHLHNMLGDHCIVAHGMEADDAMSIMAWGSLLEDKGYDVCIVSQDKDLNMVPCLHYNPVKKIEYSVSPAEGRLSFYRQLLTGDKSVDNIPGIYRMGPQTAKKIFHDGYNLSVSDNEMYSIVLNEYKKAQNNPRIKPHMDFNIPVENVILEIGRLLWMLRKEGEMWEPGVGYYDELSS